MKKPSTPYYIVNGGQPQTEIPGSAALKNTSDARVVVGDYHVVYNDRGVGTFPWVVYKKTFNDQGLNYIEADMLPQFRMALRAAKKLDREEESSSSQDRIVEYREPSTPTDPLAVPDDVSVSYR